MFCAVTSSAPRAARAPLAAIERMIGRHQSLPCGRNRSSCCSIAAANPNWPDCRGDLGELRVAHLVKGLVAFAAEQIVAAEVDIARAGQHLAQQDRFELLRGFAQLGARLVGLTIRLRRSLRRHPYCEDVRPIGMESAGPVI
jgi:hypothetical protein